MREIPNDAHTALSGSMLRIASITWVSSGAMLPIPQAQLVHRRVADHALLDQLIRDVDAAGVEHLDLGFDPCFLEGFADPAHHVLGADVDAFLLENGADIEATDLGLDLDRMLDALLDGADVTAFRRLAGVVVPGDVQAAVAAGEIQNHVGIAVAHAVCHLCEELLAHAILAGFRLPHMAVGNRRPRLCRLDRGGRDLFRRDRNCRVLSHRIAAAGDRAGHDDLSVELGLHGASPFVFSLVRAGRSDRTRQVYTMGSPAPVGVCRADRNPARGPGTIESLGRISMRGDTMSETLVVDGRGVSYRQIESSGDGCTVLMVHGATDHGWIWGSQMKALDARHRRVAIDLPGRVGTDGPPIDDAAGFRAFIKAVADGLQLEPFVFCGHSMGGSMALDFALHHPQSLAGFVMVGSSPSWGMDEAETSLLRQDPENALRQVSADFGDPFSRHTAQAIKDEMFRQAEAVPPATGAADMLACATYHLEEELASIDVPALVICGDEDDPSLPGSRLCAEKLPRAALRAGGALRTSDHDRATRGVERGPRSVPRFAGVR